ncbi:hypothetical protein [Sporichthya polymorpha]|uniref:hypothetical protein n=1 Tax=Sporichthya polymorpha TaxID=35751 RepID=UPI00037527C8|nr:hypothetical protein [Sporichthya polymorpha]
MTRSVLALPFTALRTGRKLATRLTWPVLAGAAAVVYRKVHRAEPSGTADLDAFPGDAPAAERARPVAVPTRPTATRGPEGTEREPEVVIEPVPLAEPAVDLDVAVTLPSELPIRAYDALSAKDAVTAIRELTAPEEVRTVLDFETENGKRTTVLSAARTHLTALERSVRS